MYELNKNEIIRSKKDFNRIYTKGRSVAVRDMVIYILNDARCNGKVGFAAGTKLGCAVVRNRVKRLLRETFRLSKKNIRRDCAIILVGRKSLIDKKLDAALKSFQILCKRANMNL